MVTIQCRRVSFGDLCAGLAVRHADYIHVSRIIVTARASESLRVAPLDGIVLFVIDSNHGILSSGVSGSINPPATACNAWSNWMGNAFPLFSARRRIPAQAFGVKKYRC